MARDYEDDMTRSYDYAPCPAGCGYTMDWVAGVPTCRKCGATLHDASCSRVAELRAVQSEVERLRGEIAGWQHATCCETWEEADAYVDQLVDDIAALNPPAKEKP